jgi:hypothetical protein
MNHFSKNQFDRLSSFHLQKFKFCLYSHSVERFLIIDEFDFNSISILSKILSSKISTQIVILDKIDEITHTNCLDYSILNKNIIGAKRQISSYPIKQIETPILINDKNSIYKINPASEEIIKLQNYSIFSLKVIYSLGITEFLRNIYPIGEILDTVGLNYLTSDLRPIYDYSESKIGIKKEILKIIYLSSTEDEALSKIKELWSTTGKNLLDYRECFYYYLDLPEPEELKNIKPQLNDFTRRAC